MSSYEHVDGALLTSTMKKIQNHIQQSKRKNNASTSDDDENVKIPKLDRPSTNIEFDGGTAKIPTINDMNNDLLKILDGIFIGGALKEFQSINIDVIVEKFKPILNEFYEFTAPYREQVPKYSRILNAFINELCSIYKFKREEVFVNRASYTVPLWGHLYWQFVHLSSILLSYSFEKNYISDQLDFPLLLYNIDRILPC